MRYDHTNATHETLLENNGATVRLHGYAHRLEVSTYKAVYPYEERRITAYATPVSKTSKWYRETGRELGDDWSTDLLASDPQVLAHVLWQLEGGDR